LMMSNSIENYKREELREFVVQNYSKMAVVDRMIIVYDKAIQEKKEVN